MHTNTPEPPDPRFKYEVRDLPVHDIAKAVFWFYVLVIVAAPLGLASMLFLGHPVLNAGDLDHYEKRHPLPLNAPALQDEFSATVDLQKMRRDENAVLAGRAKDRASAPPAMSIDQAIEQEAAEAGR
jgi:hypothetical protein